MRITVVGRRFEGGTWRPWEHVCDDEEVAGVLDSAYAEAFARSFSNVLTDADYQEGARYIFNRAYGTPEKPAEGDIRVTGVKVDIAAGTAADDFRDISHHKKSA
jgi:hypothetical protein